MQNLLDFFLYFPACSLTLSVDPYRLDGNMTRSLQSIVTEIQTLQISRATLLHYFALCHEVEALLPPREAQDILYQAVDTYRDQLLTVLMASVGDSRAKDIISRADDMLNPWRAIALLYAGLRYSRTSIQAQKVYLRLAERYLAIHHYRRALKYLNLTLRFEPNHAIARFTRGMLYYEQGQWKCAAADLAVFLITSDVNEKWPEYSAEAEERLREMRLAGTTEEC